MGTFSKSDYRNDIYLLANR